MQSTVSPLGRVADVLVLSTLALLQFVFVFGMPWLDNGLWPQTEGPAPAIHILSAVLALFTGLQVAFKDRRYLAALASPVVLALFAFAAFSAILAPFTPEPVRSVQGTLKHGVGVIWQFEFAIAVLAAAALWQSASYRLTILGAASLAAVGIIFLYALPGRPLGVPLAFSEWSGMLAFAVSGGLIAAVRGSSRKVSAYATAAAALIFIGGYAVSENRAVILALISVLAFLGASRIPYLRALTHTPIARASVVVFAAFASTFAVYVAGPLIEARSISAVITGDFPAVASETPVDKAHVQDTALGTIWSRSYMVRILVDDILENPLTAITGNGFGSFSTAYEHHARDVPGRFFADDRYPTASTTFWDVHTSANFHSHNMLAETVASVGVIGALLWLAAFAAMAWTSVGGAAVALGIVVVGSFWFPINHMLGGLAVLTAATVVPRKTGSCAATLISGTGPLVAILGAAFLGYVGVAAAVLGVVERSERGFPAVQVDSNLDTCGFIRTRAFPEQEIVIDLYAVLNTRVSKSENPPRELFDRSTNVLSINCMLRRYYEREGSVRALVASLYGRTSFVTLGKASYGPLRTEIIKWGEDIDRLLALVPERTEFLPPYITVLGARAPDKAIAEIDRFVPRLRDDDPVKHYLLAQRSKRTGDDDGYRNHFSRALELGFANLWPVPEAEAKRVKGQ
ncbi:hypothetical protein OIU34_18650 [Pararhizobium sp. BT-229]|uniref:hypothetical protein n=1 Tax=Pararhizobium sp. BT-229 TaxID=2986923 RepID=UPI0021F7EF1D|nr:hypothetical protein [Pararhizobium sp. BT-229]MCV9963900.1 hypothetical protein [Pararhizobium sp. BT-229]